MNYIEDGTFTQKFSGYTLGGDLLFNIVLDQEDTAWFEQFHESGAHYITMITEGVTKRVFDYVISEHITTKQEPPDNLKELKQIFTAVKKQAYH